MTDRTKEALFSSLGSVVGDAHVLDLYAGSGSLGLEALSRGAASCRFVERNRQALVALRANIEAVGLGGEVIATEVGRFLGDVRHGAGPDADLAFVDPPYDLALASVTSVLEELEPRLSEDATVIVHRRFGETPPERIDSLVLGDRRRYGDSELWIFDVDAGVEVGISDAGVGS